MPAYEFTCVPCDKTLVVSCSYEQLNQIACPDCANPMRRSYTFGAVTFNGSGFYRTDK
jgi:putative FmdB family regulatory protein